MHQSRPQPRSNLSRTLSIGLKCAAFVICSATFLSGHYPPAYAQAHRAALTAVPVLTVEDAEQDDRIEQLTKRLDAVEAVMVKQADKQNEILEDIAAFKAEERLIGFILSLLIGSSIVIQFRARTK
jgi:cell division protein FtsX